MGGVQVLGLDELFDRFLQRGDGGRQLDQLAVEGGLALEVAEDRDDQVNDAEQADETELPRVGDRLDIGGQAWHQRHG